MYQWYKCSLKNRTLKKGILRRLWWGVKISKNISEISLGKYFFTVKYTGIPIKAATAKPISCLLVRLKATFVLILSNIFFICVSYLC